MVVSIIIKTWLANDEGRWVVSVESDSADPESLFWQGAVYRCVFSGLTCTWELNAHEFMKDEAPMHTFKNLKF